MAKKGNLSQLIVLLKKDLHLLSRKLIMENFIPIDISCIFKLHEYPFDSQKCTIVLINKSMIFIQQSNLHFSDYLGPHP